jgi:hypothetical protein
VNWSSIPYRKNASQTLSPFPSGPTLSKPSFQSPVPIKGRPCAPYPKDVVSLILFGKATYRKMIQNLIWATGYNIIALPLAAGVLYKQGILLSPAAGAGLMTVSTIVVAVNAGLLKMKG